MLLKRLTIRNFRCYADVDLPIHRLTVVVGENDAGKTVILHAIELLLTAKTARAEDYRRVQDQPPAETIVLSGTFALEVSDTIPEDFRAADGATFVLTKTYEGGSPRCEIDGRAFADERFNTFARQQAGVQREILTSLGVTPAANQEQRAVQFGQLESDAAVCREPMRRTIRFEEIAAHLPRFEYISSVDYKHPDAVIQHTLQIAAQACIRPLDEATGQPRLLPQLAGIEVKIKQALDTKVAEIRETIRHVNPKVRGVEVSPTIDFTRSVTATSLMLDLGHGPELVSAYGEGTKKKLWLALLDWQRKTQEASGGVYVVRAYDEPDVNLDYSAERKLFANILESTGDPDSRVQAIVCTHAVTLIDKAPAQSINFIRVNDDGSRAIEYLDDEQDEEITAFLSAVGRSLGISNSAMLYERAFIVVEGESEEIALPILYRHLFRRSMAEDGIVLVNLQTCSAWRPILKLLKRHRAPITVLLLDADCRQADSSGRITDEMMAALDFPSDFRTNNCFYVGDKEFEDAFATHDIIEVLNRHWPRQDGIPWARSDVDRFRETGNKFAEGLIALVRNSCERGKRQSVRKPEFCAKLAEHCSTEAQIPEVVRSVFQDLRRRANCV